MAKFIEDLSFAWDSAKDEQKNKMAVELFEAVWIENGEIVAVTPKPNVTSFFDLIYARLQKDTQTGGSDGKPTGKFVVYLVATLIPDWKSLRPSRRAIPVERVPELQRAVAIGKSLRELAQEMGVSRETIRSALRVK